MLLFLSFFPSKEDKRNYVNDEDVVTDAHGNIAITSYIK